MTNEFQKAWDLFLEKVKKSSKVQKLMKAIGDRSTTYSDAQEYSSLLSDLLVQSVSEIYPTNSEDVLKALKDSYFCKSYFSHIDNYVYSMQKVMNQANNIGLNAVKPSLKTQLVNDDTVYTDNYDLDIKRYKDLVELSGNKRVDTIQQANAKFQDKAGYGITVSRKYDGRGLSDGRTCEWCLERVGSNVPYKQAVSRGMFQRHEGCHCIIEYNNNGEKTRQYSMGSRYSWYQANDLNNELSQAYKKAERMEEKQFAIQSQSVKNNIKARKIKGYEGVFVSDGAVIKPRKLHEINKINNSLVEEYKITKKPNILIVTNEELNYNVGGLYIATINTTVYPNDVAKGTQKHEMMHCKQADEFKKENGEITKENYSHYLTSICLKAKERLEKRGLTVDKIKEYGEYFERMYAANRFDEIEAQLEALEE